MLSPVEKRYFVCVFVFQPIKKQNKTKQNQKKHGQQVVAVREYCLHSAGIRNVLDVVVYGNNTQISHT